MSKIGRNEKCPCGSGAKFKKCHMNVELGKTPIFLRAEKHVITVTCNNNSHKLFQIFYDKNGHLYVDFPYFHDSNGVCGLLTLKAGIKYPTNVNLTDNGKVTSHLVKYSHKQDGEAHFSQDGKVKTMIRKNAAPLHDIEGHLFTIMLQGIDGFEQVTKKKDHHQADPKRTVINFNYADKEPESLKFVCRIYDPKNSKFGASANVDSAGPIIKMKVEGENVLGYMLAPPDDNPLKRYLFLSVEGIEKINQKNEPTLSFIGGFDSFNQVNDYNVDTSMLSLLYPATNFDELEPTIGSMDFRKEITGL